VADREIQISGMEALIHRSLSSRHVLSQFWHTVALGEYTLLSATQVIPNNQMGFILFQTISRLILSISWWSFARESHTYLW